MIPVICFVGVSDCGKTTLLEKVIPLLKNKSYHVGVVKNDTHGFDVDKEGKDTYRHKQAGAKAVLISGPDQFAIISDTDRFLTLEDFTFLMGDKVDIILTEGFKSSDKPKIEIFLDGVSSDILCKNDPALIGIATNNMDRVKKLTDKTIFDMNNPEQIADFIEDHYILKKKRKVFLTVNGKKIKIKDFVEDIIASTVKGMVAELKDCENPKDIRLIISEE
jgi:molybdopterin-guanine dinucleotide biosynthesis protein B